MQKINTQSCIICKGSGSLRCWACEGSGCDECSGKGSLQCSNCEGQGVVPNSKEISCPYCNKEKVVICFWCGGKGVTSNTRRYPEKRCVHCQGRGKRRCPDCGGSGFIADELKSALLGEWRRRLAAEFERMMLTALSEWLGKKNPASIWVGNFSISTPSPKCGPYQLIDEFETRLMVEDPDGLETAYEDPTHPYSFLLRCKTLWDHDWHDLGHPDFGWPESVLDMLRVGTPDEDLI